MPAIPRQLFGDLSEAIESRLSTASVDLFGPTSELAPTASTTQDLLLPTIPLIPGLTSQLTSLVPATPTPTIIFTSQAVTTTSATPTTTSEASTTPLLTSIQIVPTSSSTLPFTTPATTPVVSTDPEVIASTSALVVTQSRSTSASATATGASSDASITPDSGLGSGIVALIVIGALLGALLAGAFVLRRVQVRRRANRRRNSYGSPAVDTTPFPFTNVSESDLKGAQPIRDPRTNYDKPLPRIIPDVYPALPDPTYNQYNQHVDNGVSGPYQTMGGAAMGYGYGYEQPGRVSSTSSPAQATRMTSPSPPPAAYTPGPYVYPNPLPQTPTPAPALSVPVSSGLSVPQAGGKKRVIQTFQPTLPDELDVHEGDWVTVLHAYDDGWGLCECNGSRGVVPLECLDPGKPDFRASRRLSSLSAIRQ